MSIPFLNQSQLQNKTSNTNQQDKEVPLKILAAMPELRDDLHCL